MRDHLGSSLVLGRHELVAHIVIMMCIIDGYFVDALVVAMLHWLQSCEHCYSVVAGNPSWIRRFSNLLISVMDWVSMLHFLIAHVVMQNLVFEAHCCT